MTVFGSGSTRSADGWESCMWRLKMSLQGPMGAREVVDGWLHSPGHRRNIEGDFRLTGIGLAEAP
jgi:hypothetical protein